MKLTWTRNGAVIFTFITFLGFHFESGCDASGGAPSSKNTTEWVGISNACLCQEFRCSNGTFCLHKSKVCSGFPDCLNGEDELRERCQNARKKGTKNNCSKDEFKCKFGGCIKLSEVCDKKVDCWGGVDEALDFCSWVNN